jgi:hypothetical protein
VTSILLITWGLQIMVQIQRQSNNALPLSGKPIETVPFKLKTQHVVAQFEHPAQLRAGNHHAPD